MGEITYEIIRAVEVTDDLQIHVTIEHTPSGAFLDIRQYVPSLDRYGRGITIPERILDEISEAVTDVAEQLRA